MTVNEGWLDTLIFTVLFEEGVDDVTHSGVVVVEFHAMLLSQGFGLVEVHSLPEVHTRNFLNQVYHMATSPRLT